MDEMNEFWKSKKCYLEFLYSKVIEEIEKNIIVKFISY